VRSSDKKRWVLTNLVRFYLFQRNTGMANKLNVSIISVTVLTGSGTDLVSIKFEGPSPFPEIQASSPEQDYGPSLKVETRKGYALEWLKSIGVPMDLVNVIDSGRRP
jgi:hypothetical protein